MTHSKFTPAYRIRSPRIHQSGDGKGTIAAVECAGQGLGLSGMGSAIYNTGSLGSDSLQIGWLQAGFARDRFMHNFVHNFIHNFVCGDHRHSDFGPHSFIHYAFGDYAENSANSAKFSGGVVVGWDKTDRLDCDLSVQDRLAPDHPIRHQLSGLRPTTGSGRYRCNPCDTTVLTQD
jgi:hypothetical protein